MIIVRLSGGLGNQMFQYAAGLTLAQRHGSQLLFDLEWFDAFQLHQGLELHRVFGLELPVASAEEKWGVLGWLAMPRLRKLLSRHYLRQLRPSSLAVEPYFHFWPGFKELPSDVYVDGYWQSERYFLSAEDRVRDAFRFAVPLDARNACLVQHMEATSSISLHVRRGDFAHNAQVTRVHGVDLAEYYRLAIEAIGREVADPHYFVFSDEPEWVRENLEIEAPWTLVEHNRGVDSYRDMQLMSCCKHHILANSTFSWWGGWLNPSSSKRVVAPAQWLRSSELNTDDICPAAWIRL